MLNRRRKHCQMFNVSVLFTIFRTAAWHQTSSTIHQPVANWPISVLTTFINTKKNEIYRVFSLTWPAYMQIYWNKRKRLHKKRVQLPEYWFGKHDHRFIVLGHQYGRRDIMWKHSIRFGVICSLPADVLWGSFVTHSFLPHGRLLNTANIYVLDCLNKPISG